MLLYVFVENILNDLHNTNDFSCVLLGYNFQVMPSFKLVGSCERLLDAL